MRMGPIPFVLATVVLFGCGDRDAARAVDETLATSSTADSTPLVRPSDSESSPRDLDARFDTVLNRSTEEPIHLVFLGTSLTEGLGLARPDIEAWPARVEDLARAAGIRIEVRNAGLSGETSAGALARLEWVLADPTDVLIVETGANDGLRGLPVAQLESNLEAIVASARVASPGLRIVLAGMEAPTNMGVDYQRSFREVFARVADRYDTALIPFLLDGVAGEPSLNQADGVHPTAEGHLIVAAVAWPILQSVLTTFESAP